MDLTFNPLLDPLHVMQFLTSANVRHVCVAFLHGMISSFISLMSC